MASQLPLQYHSLHHSVPNQWDIHTGPNWKRSDLQTVSEESGPSGRHYQSYTKGTSNSVDLGI